MGIREDSKGIWGTLITICLASLLVFSDGSALEKKADLKKPKEIPAFALLDRLEPEGYLLWGRDSEPGGQLTHIMPPGEKEYLRIGPFEIGTYQGKEIAVFPTQDGRKWRLNNRVPVEYKEECFTSKIPR